MKCGRNKLETIQRRLWDTEQEILDEFHRVCTENGLRYSLAYGTLLGAVRHKGFIPWDDDIDVLMPRDDYQILQEIWKRKATEKYILQEPYTSPDLVINFTKIRKDRTTFIQAEFEKNRKYHKGIFIDVFPLDRVAKGRIRSSFQRVFCMLSMLYNRGYKSGKGGIVSAVESILLRIVPKAYYRKAERLFEKMATKWNNDSTLEWFGFQTVQDMKHHYSSDAFDGLVELEFSNKRYYVFREYDKVLVDEFGDYMQLPSEDERIWKHHPLLINFERNFEELTDKREA